MLTNLTGNKPCTQTWRDRVCCKATQMGELSFLSEEGKKLTDYSRQSALTDCKNKMAIYFVFRMLHIFAWHKRMVWSHPYQAVTDKYSACLLLNTVSATDVYTIAQTLQMRRMSNPSRLSQAQALFEINKMGSHKFKILFSPLKTNDNMYHSDKFSEALKYLSSCWFCNWKKEKSWSKYSKNCCNSQCVLEIITSYTYYNSTQLTQNLKMKMFWLCTSSHLLLDIRTTWISTRYFTSLDA